MMSRALVQGEKIIMPLQLPISLVTVLSSALTRVIEPSGMVIDPQRGADTIAEFRAQYRELFEGSPLRAVKLFLLYLDAHGLDVLSRTMAPIATPGSLSLTLLLDAVQGCCEDLSFQAAIRIVPLVCRLDDQFSLKLARTLGDLQSSDSILNALRLVPAMGDYSILIPYLRSCAEHPDARARSRAAKLLCQLRPNRGLLDRYLHSADARVRAGVMEALWDPKALRDSNELLPLIRAASEDPNHRVAANALVSLYRLGQTEAFQKMLLLCANKQHLFRAASAWAMGTVEDSRAIPTLRQLTLDRSYTVRLRASTSLSALSASGACVGSTATR